MVHNIRTKKFVFSSIVFVFSLSLVSLINIALSQQQDSLSLLNSFNNTIQSDNMTTLSGNRITASSVSASNFDLVSVYIKLKESVVSITDTLPDNNNSNANTINIGNCTDIFTNNSGTTGTGFVYDTKGHIITSLGVVTDTHVQQVEFSDGTIYDAKVIGSDPYSDIAVLLVEDVPIDKLKPVEFITNSSDVLVSEQTATIGNHFDSKATIGWDNYRHTSNIIYRAIT